MSEHDGDVEARVREAVEQEREACARIAEDHLKQLQYGHGAEGERMILNIITEIRARGESDGS